jgi:glycosyltransferase involved in cell wall biosynthesis
MTFSLVICTYKRPTSIDKLLASVSLQTLYPDEVIIVDSSPDEKTKLVCENYKNKRVCYVKVSTSERGLTKQRNIGVSKTTSETDVICFLDDDILLKRDYFENLIGTYKKYPEAVGVGGYIINEIKWEKKDKCEYDEFNFDGYVRKLGRRHLLRKKLNLLSDCPPGFMPKFSNGFSIGFLPPSGKIYPVEFFMGGVSSYRRWIFDKCNFSEFFVGYGLYEDMDFCLRVSNRGKLYVNTSAKVLHYHEEAGRPNKFEYGKMVLRNGWHVWKTKYPNIDFKNKLKWHAIALLLILIRAGNIFNTSKRKVALTESLGRVYGWWSILLNKPRHNGA